jgi:hypothetical protein
LSGCEINFVGERLEAIVRERERLSIEGVSFDDVSAGVEIFAVNGFNDGGLREAEEVVKSLEVTRGVLEAVAAIGGFIEFMLLGHGSHGAIEDEDALRKSAEELFNFVRDELRFCFWCHDAFLNAVLKRLSGLNIGEKTGGDNYKINIS